ncbi:YhcH/YjgK/YiaL family protein [Paenibacillus radicis (ex Xue et al. 2023)]|uniref:YhcH/YjgK/YiaL family protein n=1 Tax=Paenibacillus radicis (ex Xue et al. 2023) TaxID=2972489 RepID=A0ABT1YER3_9BACL|nr:YhcH/YjgK/YiaL family protein [Paenibacillus radicis (ex Xue et al. 2023)]MCR8631690.1 YhcH/YjgK/YiaL family protein [Paenibacillus radicis (ex Xue et al. 2023)]
MIIDHINNASLYYGLNGKFAAAFQYLQEHALDGMDPGKYEIQGSELFLMIQSYDTRRQEEGFWEAHRSYIDIQIMLEGTERMGYAYAGHLTTTEDHLDEKDYKVLEGDGGFVDVKEHCFVIFYPDDAHMPCLAAAYGSAPVKKAVFKVKI